MTTDIWERLQPLQLAVGSHQKGSGAGCAMNVISYENGDTEITDFPDCSDRVLARMVQEVNDRICPHGRYNVKVIPLDNVTLPYTNANESVQVQFVKNEKIEKGIWGVTVVSPKPKLLCPECSIKVLQLGHRTVGTNLKDHGYADGSRLGVYFELVLKIMERVDLRGLNSATMLDVYETTRALEYIKKRLNNTATARDHLWATREYMATRDCIGVAHAIYGIGTHDVIQSYGNFFTTLYLCGVAGNSLLEFGHKVIDIFEEITGINSAPLDEAKLEAAVKEMREPVNA